MLVAVGVVLVCVVAVVMAWELNRFRRGESLLDRRQLGLRVGGAVLLAVLIIQVLGGIAFVPYSPDLGQTNPRAAVFFLSYWLSCGLMTLVLLIIVRIDFIYLERKHLQEETRLAREQLGPRR